MTDAELVNRFQRSGRFHEFTCGCPAWGGPETQTVEFPFGQPLDRSASAVQEGDEIVLVCPRRPGCGHHQVLTDDLLEMVRSIMAVPAESFSWLSNPNGDPPA